MDWEQAIERQRRHLGAIIASLYAMLGLADGGNVSRLPVPLYRAALRILYPAESAVRRLIFAVARGLVATLPQRRRVPPARKQSGSEQSAGKSSARMPFNLCDARRVFSHEGDHRKGTAIKARMHVFSDGQLVTIIGLSPLAPVPQPQETADATRLFRRLAAVRWALENLPREAERLARWKARRAAMAPEKRRKPLRPGRPPGSRRNGGFEVDEVLKDCHWLAWEAAKLDTS